MYPKVQLKLNVIPNSLFTEVHFQDLPAAAFTQAKILSNLTANSYVQQIWLYE